MNVVYFAVGQEHAQMAELAAKALRLFHPDWDAYVLTDPDTQFQTLKPVRGYCSQMTLMYDRAIMQRQFLMEHLNQYEPTLFLDSDCIVNRPLTGFMHGPVGVTWREPPKQAKGMNINGGVLWCEGRRALAVWSHMVDLFQYFQRDAWAWYGDQIALSEMHKEYSKWVYLYPCETHNYAWANPWECESILPSYIVHFKGTKRKALLPQYVSLLEAVYGAQDLRRSA